MHAYSIALMLQPAVVATTLLCAMCAPLSTGFLVYHAYLLWAGMTTNESGKWAEWGEDVRDGLVWRARLGTLRKVDAEGEGEGEGELPSEANEGWLPEEVEPRPWDVDWPPKGSPGWWHNGQQGRCKAKWWYIRTREGEQPMMKDGEGREVVDGRWERVHSLRKEVTNVYDLGLWANLWEVVWHRE